METLQKQLCFIDAIIGFLKTIASEENDNKISLDRDGNILQELKYKYRINQIKIPENIVVLDMYIYYSSLLNNLEKTLLDEDEKTLFKFWVIDKYLVSDLFVLFEKIPQNYYSLISVLREKTNAEKVLFTIEEKVFIEKLYTNIKII